MRICYYVVLVLGSTSTSPTTVAANTVGYGGGHTMGVGGGDQERYNAHPVRRIWGIDRLHQRMHFD